MLEYKKISFRVDEDTYNRLQEHSKLQYLTVSAYIRKYLDLQLQKEDLLNDESRVFEISKTN